MLIGETMLHLLKGVASRFATWIDHVFGVSERSATDDVMLSYFISTLDVRTTGLVHLLTDQADKAIYDDISRSLSGFMKTYNPSATTLNENAWNEAYRLERLLALIEPPDNLWPELKRRIAETKEENLASTARLSTEADLARQLVFDSQTPPALKPNGPPVLRALLLDTLEELHWAFQRKFYSRPIRKQATTRIVLCGMFAFCLFILPYIILDIEFWDSRPNIGSSWAWLPLYSSLTAGLFGALFSRLLYLQQNWDALTIGGLKDAREFTSILLRGCVGMTGAVIVSFFLQSSVISGSLFPEFDKIGLEAASYPATGGTNDNTVKAPNIHQVPAPKIDQPHVTLPLIYPSKSLALLVVWSFLAGFSERLVPSILKDTESSLGRTGKS